MDFDNQILRSEGVKQSAAQEGAIRKEAQQGATLMKNIVKGNDLTGQGKTNNPTGITNQFQIFLRVWSVGTALLS
jgi:hypothetical protein